MSNWNENLTDRLVEYAERHNIQLVDELGYGYDGTVVSTTRQTALKALRY